MDIQNLSLAELRESIYSESISIVDVAAQTNNNIEHYRELNTIISTDAELLISNAKVLDEKITKGERLPLHGIPILLKDNIDTVDFPTTGGTPALENHQPKLDAGVVTRLKEAGALIVGKANMHELAFGITSNNAHSGAVHNPYDETMITGGSSGGSAAAVSANIVTASLGSDTGGSNRIPAALCGVSGFRPSTGRYPGDGMINLSKTRDTAGVFAQKVSDIVIVDDVLCGGSKPTQLELKDIRLAIARDPFYKGLEKETSVVIEDTLTLLKNKGANIVEIDMKEMFALNDKVSFQVAVYETVRDLRDYLAKNNIGITLEQMVEAVASPDVKHLMQASLTDRAVPEAVYQDAINIYRPQMQEMYALYFADNNIDAMLYPTTILTARPIGDDKTVEINGEQAPTFPSYVRNGDPASNAGIPSLSIPAGMASNGLPVGLCIDGPVNSDDAVLAIGSAIAANIPSIMGPFM